MSYKKEAQFKLTRSAAGKRSHNFSSVFLREAIGHSIKRFIFVQRKRPKAKSISMIHAKGKTAQKIKVYVQLGEKGVCSLEVE